MVERQSDQSSNMVSPEGTTPPGDMAGQSQTPLSTSNETSQINTAAQDEMIDSDTDQASTWDPEPAKKKKKKKRGKRGKVNVQTRPFLLSI